jgi:3-polyprenyl-4-hydroxybenzoate decarboxylase
MNLGSKMVLDAQSKPGRARRAPAAPDAVPDPRTFAEGVIEWRLKWGGVLVVKVRGAVGGATATWDAASQEAASATAGSPGRAAVEALVRRAEYAALPLIVAVGEDVSLDDDRELVWGWWTRFDCARDVIPAATETRGAWTTCRGPLGVDASWKAGYPEVVASAPETVTKVDGWWRRGG